MKSGYLRLFFPLLALLLAILSVRDFVSRLPETTSFNGDAAQQDSVPTGKLMEEISILIARASSNSADSAASVAPGSNPFRIPAPAKRASAVRVAPRPPPPRPSRLKGTVEDKVATLLDARGHSVIVKLGDLVDSAKVVQIGPGYVKLRDRAGTFELVLQGD